MATSTTFLANGRYELLERLGAGGMGVVYRALDHQVRAQVALKTLKNAEQSAVYFLKQEFRSLAHIFHRNLVNLYELEVNDRESFFTMELVDGLSLDRHLKFTDRLSSTWSGMFKDTASSASVKPARPEEPEDSEVSKEPSSAPEHFKRLDESRFRKMLLQLAQGLMALHQAGKLHRDIKPSNVMLTEEDRAVILDFGLVLNLDVHANQRSGSSMVGTPAYMSPEQVSGQTVSVASDWYSYGALLYEALTGRLPHQGTAFEIILAKTMTRPIHPLHLYADLPKDLCELTMLLLDVLPEARPTGEEVLAALRGEERPAQQAVWSAPSSVFVGRKGELEALERGLRRSLLGHTSAVHIFGPSGLGKTALVRHFLRDVAPTEKFTVLQGRCYERESVPYKSIDGLVDRIFEHWSELSHELAQALIPPDIELLLELFPVLQRVPALQLVSPQAALLDAPSRRRRAFAALRALIYNIARQKPLILFLDDLQWGDSDSAAFLELLCEAQDTQPLLVLAAYRSEDIVGSPLLNRLTRVLGPHTERVEIKPLSEVDRRVLAQRLLGPDGGAAQRIADEAFGNPWLIQELAHSVGRAEPKAEVYELKGFVQQRLSSLGDEARRLAEVIAVASRPLQEEVAFEAAGVGGDQRALVQQLKNLRLIEARARAAMLESHHDRIRALVLESLGAGRAQRYHLALGEALERREADPLTLLEHFRAGEDRARTLRYARAAAERADEALAFEQAALLYQETFELEQSQDVKLELGARLAQALVNAGQSAEGARWYERLASMVPEAGSARVLTLQQRAAEQYLRSGLIDEGARLLKRVARAVGIPVPERPAQVIARVLLNALSLKLRGLKPKPQPAPLPEQVRLKLDICFGAYAGLSLVDPLLASYFQGRALRLALDAGEPARLARALASEAVRHASLGGEAGRARFAEVIQLAESAVEQTEDPYARANVIFEKGSGALLSGRWKEALELHERALGILKSQCTGVTWEVASGEMLVGTSLARMGALERFSEQQEEVLRAMDQLGDRYVSTILRVGNATLLHLAEDQPQRAQEEVRVAMASWPSAGFSLQHFNALHSVVHIALYEGRGDDALAEVERAWPQIKRALLLRLQELRIELRFLKAKAALAASAGRGGQAALRTAAEEGALLMGEDLLLGPAHGEAILGAVALMEGKDAEARLERAEGHFEALRMAMMQAAVARLRGGEHAALERVQPKATERFFEVLLPCSKAPRAD